MVLQGLRTNRNVSTSLALSIFDKQIAPILLYGCSIWAMPRSHNLIYIEDQPENINTQTLVNRVFDSVLGQTVGFDYARRVGKSTANSQRKILVKLKNYSDKERLLASYIDNTRYKISNFVNNNYSEMAKMHLDYCKKSLNLSKYTSNAAVQGELGIFPIEHRAYSLAVKYWLRLHNTTKNVLLNEAFNVVQNDNHEWIQSIQSLLCTNGFRYVWLNPMAVNPENFHKILRRRLDDQYIQIWRDKITSSSRFSLLGILDANSSGFARSSYINIIQNPDTREMFTRLRIDTNILASSAANRTRNPDGLCVNCTLDLVETPEHFLFQCPKFENYRQKLIQILIRNDPCFDNMSDIQRTIYVLDLKCPNQSIGACCKYINNLYKMRVEMNS